MALFDTDSFIPTEGRRRDPFKERHKSESAGGGLRSSK